MSPLRSLLLAGRFVAVLSLLSVGSLGAAQTASFDFNKYGGAPEAWRPSELKDAGVDARGDLNLDLPILAIPGRGGLGYEVRFQYASGIRYDQPSSWIGGGWFFDPGSISRDVHGSVVVGSTPYNVDFTNVPAYQPDHYQLTLPGGSSSMVRQGGGTSAPPRQNPSGFTLTSYRAWKVEATTSTPVTVDGVDTSTNGFNQADYKQFIVTTENGVRYVFEKPTLATYLGLTSSFGYQAEHYVAMWRLVAILGTDYQGNAVPSGDGSETGSWVLLRYGNVATKSSLDISPCGDVPANPRQYAQSQYLTEIVTPTHKAVFSTDGRGQETFPGWQQGLHKRLTEIKLYALNGLLDDPGTLIRTVTLQNDQGGFSIPTDTGCTGSSRLALNGIQFKGQNNTSEPGYAFTYYPKPAGGTLRINTDHFGFYDSAGGYLGDFNANSTDGAAWSLRTVRYPTGGRDSVVYENDVLDDAEVSFSTYTSGTGQGAGAGTGTYVRANDQTRQGGTQVKEIHRFDGINAAATTTFSYGSGRLTGVPQVYWRTQFDGRAFFAPVDRGRVAIHYEHVQRTNPDGSTVKTFYTTRGYLPAGTSTSPVRGLQTLAWQTAGPAAMTVVQGNQDWNWGRPYKTEYGYLGNATREVVVTHDLNSNNVITAWGTPSVTVERGYADRVTKQVETELSGSTASTTTEYSYFDDAGSVTSSSTGNHLLEQVDVTHEDGRKRRTILTYAYEKYATLAGANRLAAVAKEDIAEVSTSGTATYHASTVTTHKSYSVTTGGGGPGGARMASGSGTVTLFEPYQSFAWAASSPSTTQPSFSAWNGMATPSTPPSGWEFELSNEVYNENGFATSIIDPRGGTTTLTYNNLGRLTAVRAPTPSSGVVLQRSYAYSAACGLLTSVTDENAQTETYGYDNLCRLQSVTNPAGTQTLGVAYATTNVPYSVTTTRYTGATPSQNVSVAFYDGLGRPIQTQDRISATSWAVTATEYSPGSSATSVPARERAFRPYNANTGGAYTSGYLSAATSYYGSGSKPYTDTELKSDATGRVSRVVHPYVGTTAPVTAYAYRVGQVDGAGPSYRYTEVTDEDGWKTQTYTDAWGRAFRTVEAVGVSGTEAKTHTVFDVMGRPKEIQTPNHHNPPGGPFTGDWVSYMTYDTQGQLTHQYTPDAGNTYFKYDRAGALRFSQDADQAQTGKVTFTTYDALGRPLNTGVAAATFSSLNGNSSYTWENQYQNLTEARYYDQKPPAQISIPFELFETEINQASLSYLKGRLVASSSISAGTRRLELSSYTREGRLLGHIAHTRRNGSEFNAALLYDTNLSYGYDLQGRLLTRTTTVGTGTSRRRSGHWYDYDERGLNTRVYAAATTGSTAPAKPSTIDATYTYDPAGAVASVRYRTQTAVPYRYDVRGRLTDIGGTSWSTANLSGRPFIAHYDYSNAGDVTNGQFGHNTNGASGTAGEYFRFAYYYDARHRLTLADYFNGGTTGTFTASGSYDVTNLTYDPNGNLKTLRRRDRYGALVDNLTYNYTTNNRVTTLSDAAGATASTAWDAEAGSFAYDLRGNATSLPAPYNLTLTYDHRSLPLTANAVGVTSAYRYSADGQRFWRYGTAPTEPPPAVTAPQEPTTSAALLGALPARPHLGDTAPPGTDASSETAPASGTPSPEAASLQTVTARSMASPTSDSLRTASTSPWATARTAPDTTDGRGPARLGAPSGARTGEAPPASAERPAPEAPAPERSASPWASAQPGRRPATGPERPAPVSTGQPPDAPASAPPTAGAESAVAAGSAQTTTSFEFLVLDGHSAAGLRPVVGYISGEALSEESQASAPVTWSLLSPSGEVIGQVYPNGTSRHYYHKDLLGSTRAVVTEAGALAEHRAYDPWGVRLEGRLPALAVGATGGVREGFTGKPRLIPSTGGGGITSGLDDFGARAYAPAFGRFLQVDPLWTKHPEWTPYHYVLNNPLALVDPDGRQQVAAGPNQLATSTTVRVMTSRDVAANFERRLEAARNVPEQNAGVNVEQAVRYIGAWVGLGLDAIAAADPLGMTGMVGIGSTAPRVANAASATSRSAGWLQFHEARGGHTIARHVGQSESSLLARLASNSQISGASTFTSQSVAESIISSTIGSNRSAVRAWLTDASPGSRLALNHSGSAVIGRGVQRGQSSARNLTDARVVLQADANGSYYVLTAYPTF